MGVLSLSSQNLQSVTLGHTRLRVNCSQLASLDESLIDFSAVYSQVDCALQDFQQLSSRGTLRTLALSGSQVRGTMSGSWGNATRLNLLALNDLNLFGTVGPLPASLETLFLHNNRLSGRLPLSLTLPENLNMPSPARLKTALVLIGNEIESPVPDWVRNSSDFKVAAVTYSKTDVQDLLEDCAGLPALFLLFSCIVAFCSKRRTEEKATVSVTTHLYLHLVRTLALALAGLSVFSLCALLPTYVSNSGFLEFGRAVSHTSIAMLSAQGWLVAGFLAVYNVLLLLVVTRVIKSVVLKAVPPSETVPSRAARPLEVKRWACATVFYIGLYLLVLCVCSFPTLLAVVLDSAPPDNRLGIPVDNQAFQVLFSEVAAPGLMVLSNSVVIPWAARSTATRFKSVTTATVILVFVGLFTNTLVAPTVATVLFDTNCMRGFFLMWDQCEPQNLHQLTSNITVRTSFGRVVNVTVLSGKDVCSASQLRYGFCSRAFVGWVGPFMARKFLFFAFVSPGLLLLCSSLCHKLPCRWEEKRVRVGNDLPLLLSQFEVAAILANGAFVPVLLPVALLSFTTNLFARRWVLLSSGCGVELAMGTTDVGVSRFLVYMFLSPVLLGLLVCLFFWENSASVVGGLGLPELGGLPVAVASSVLSAGLSLVYLRTTRVRASSKLQEPLLSGEVEGTGIFPEAKRQLHARRGNRGSLQKY